MARGICFGAAILFAAGAAAAADLTIGLQRGPSTLDPHYHLTGQNTGPLRNIYETLTFRSPDLQPIPGLAASWRIVDDTTWEFRLNEGVTFHDGSPLTAEDVRFTLARIPNVPGNPNSYAVFTAGILEVQVVDPLTFRFRTSAPHPLLPANLTNIFIASSAKGERRPEEFNAGSAAVGTGPYRVAVWKPNEPLLLERNPRYWGRAPDWERVTFRPVPNNTARVAALLAGDVDLVAGVPLQDAERLKTTQGMAVFAGPSTYVYSFWPNVNPEFASGAKGPDGAALARNPLADRRVRQAISLAVSRNALVERIMAGFATPAGQPVPSQAFGADPSLTPEPQDIERARALLAEAGFPRGFSIELNCANDRFPNDAKLCEAIGQMLARVGIAVSVQANPITVFLPRRARGELPFFMAGIGTLTGEAGYFVGGLMHSRDRERGLGALNFTQIADPKLDALVQQARTELDDATRAATLREALQLNREEQYVIPVLTFQALWAGRADRATITPRMDEETVIAEMRKP